MKSKLIAAVILALVLALGFSAVAGAAVPQSTIDAIIKDAADGTIDGNWTDAEIRAALAFLEKNPTYKQYGDTLGALEDYLASERDPGERAGELAFTGGEIFAILAAGAGLVGSGALLRRRHT